MRISTIFRTAILGAVAVPALALAITNQEPEEPVDPRILAYDQGPSKIDISKYPSEMKARYKTFTIKCGKCHTLARPINCDFVLEGEWERYVKRMMRKAGTFINPEQGKEIYEFVVYDSKVRKKEMYERRLRETKSSGS